MCAEVMEGIHLEAAQAELLLLRLQLLLLLLAVTRESEGKGQSNRTQTVSCTLHRVPITEPKYALYAQLNL